MRYIEINGKMYRWRDLLKKGGKTGTTGAVAIRVGIR